MAQEEKRQAKLARQLGQLAAQRRLETQLRAQMAGRRLVAVSAQPTRDQLGLHVRLEFSDSSHSVWLHFTTTSARRPREAPATLGRSPRTAQSPATDGQHSIIALP